MDTKELIAERVRSRREYLGLTQEEIARSVSMSPVNYGHYERARQDFTVPLLMELSKLLDVPLSYLTGEQLIDRSFWSTYDDNPQAEDVAAADAILRAFFDERRKRRGGTNDEG